MWAGISAAATTEPNGSGWYSGDVTVHFTCSDAPGGSGLASCRPDQTLSGEGAGIHSTAESISDNAGNTTAAGYAQSPSFKIDTVAPSVSDAELFGTMGNGIWWLSPVTA